MPKKTLIGALFFLITTLIWFFPTIFQNKAPLPVDIVHDYLLGEETSSENGIIRDAVVQMYPYADFEFRSYKAGEFPDFNPHIFGGISHLSSGQSTALSLLNLFIPLFSSSLSFFCFKVVFYFFLAGFGMFLFLLGREFKPWLCLLGGLMFQFCGPVIAWSAWGTMVGVMAMLPFMLWALDRFISSGKWPWLLALTGFNYVALTSGHYQVYLYAALVVFFYALSGYKKDHFRPYAAAGALNLLMVVLVGLPFLQAYLVSHRAGLTDSSFLHLENLAQLAFPDIWGDHNDFTGPLNYVETMIWAGPAPFVLVAFAIFKPRLLQCRKYFFWYFFLFAVLVYNFIPVRFLGSFPPFRSFFVADFIMMFLAVAALSNVKRMSRFAVGALMVFTVAGAWIFFHDYAVQQPRDDLENPPAYVGFLSGQGNPLVYSEVSPLNLYSLYGIRSLFGYDTNYPEAYFREIKQHAEKVRMHRNILKARIRDWEYLRGLGVDFVVSKKEFDLERVFQDNDVKVYKL